MVSYTLRLGNTPGGFGSIAQLGEHMPYKHGVTGSSPVVPTTPSGAVVQLVRTPACHAGGRGFKSLPRRHIFLGACEFLKPSEGWGKGPFQVTIFAAVAQSVERILGKDEVGGSNPPSSSKTPETSVSGVFVLSNRIGRPEEPSPGLLFVPRKFDD